MNFTEFSTNRSILMRQYVDEIVQWFIKANKSFQIENIDDEQVIRVFFNKKLDNGCSYSICTIASIICDELTSHYKQCGYLDIDFVLVTNTAVTNKPYFKISFTISKCTLELLRYYLNYNLSSRVLNYCIEEFNNQLIAFNVITTHHHFSIGVNNTKIDQQMMVWLINFPTTLTENLKTHFVNAGFPTVKIRIDIDAKGNRISDPQCKIDLFFVIPDTN